MRASLAALVLVIVSCSTGGPPPVDARALPHNQIVKKLDAGTVDSLPTGSVYVRFIRFAQPPGYVINSKQHVPSMVYVVTGVQRLVLTGQTPIDLMSGQATFHQSVTHQHLNPGSATSTWFSIAVWPSSARGTPLVDPIARAAFESEDIDRVALPLGAYSEALREVTLAHGGTSGAHRFGGLATFYVLSGSISILSAHGARQQLGPDQGATFLPDTDLQETDNGPDQASYIEFFVTPVGTDFEVPLQRAPAS